MVAKTSLDALLDSLYRSVATPDSLGEFLDLLNRATRSHISTVLMHDYATGRGSLPAITGLQVDAMVSYEQRYAAENVWMERIAPTLRVGSLNNSDALVPLAELRATTFWREYLSLVDVDHCIGITGAFDTQNAAQLSLCRSNRVGSYDAAELRLCAAITPHWVNACQIRRQLGTLHDTVVSLQSALDRVALAVAFVDANGRVVRANHGAERLFGRGDVITLNRQHLVACDPADARRLHNAITAATHATRATARLALHDANGIPAAFANVLPLSHSSPNVGAKAVVFVRDTFGGAPTDLGEVLSEMFGLTPSEARVATALYSTGDLAEAARQVGLGQESARQRLKLVFDKTGVRGQPALVRVIADLSLVLSE